MLEMELEARCRDGVVDMFVRRRSVNDWDGVEARVGRDSS
jgi:hypothetical protein